MSLEDQVEKGKFSHTDLDTSGHSSLMTIKSFSRKYGVDRKVIKSRIGELPSITGLLKNNPNAKFYEEPSLLQKIGEFINLPMVDKHSGMFSDSDGEILVTISYLCERYSGRISRPCLVRCLSTINPQIGRGKGGSKASLFPLTEAAEAIDTFLALPQVDEESGFYQDTQGEIYAYEGYFVAKYKIDHKGFKKFTESVRLVLGRNRAGRAVSLYCVSDMAHILGSIDQYPFFNSREKFAVDQKGDQYVSARFLRDTFGIGEVVNNKLLETARRTRFRLLSGEVVELINLEDAKKLLELFHSLPRVDHETGEYQDGHGEVWVALRYANIVMGVLKSSNGIIERSARSIVGRDKIGQRTKLYNKIDISRLLKEDNSLSCPRRSSPKKARSIDTSKITFDEANEGLDEYFKDI